LKTDVIIVSYHSGHLISSAIAKVSAIVDSPHVVVVNNDPADILATTAGREVGATVIVNQTNRGFAAAVNQGVQAGDGDLVVLLNPDIDELRGEWRQLTRLFDDPRVAAAGVRLLQPDGTLQPSCRREPTAFDFLSESLALSQRLPRWARPKRFRMLDWSYDAERVVDAASGALLVIRRRAIDDVGCFDERFFVYSEELDWLVRAKRRGWKTVFTPTVSIVHQGGGSTDSSRSHLDRLLLQSWYAWAAKYFSLPQRVGLRAGFVLVDVARLVSGSAEEREAARARLVVHLGLRTAGAR
jgi:hypothetical protein